MRLHWIVLVFSLILFAISFFTVGFAGFIGVILALLGIGFSIGWFSSYRYFQ